MKYQHPGVKYLSYSKILWSIGFDSNWEIAAFFRVSILSRLLE